MFFRNENRMRHTPFGDPREQEQEKCAHEESAQPTKDEPRRIESPASIPREEIPSCFPMECPARTLPDAPSEKRLVRSEENALFDGTPIPSRRVRRGSARFGSYLVMSASLLVAFLLMIGALCALPGEKAVETPMPESSEEAADKVVFVESFSNSAGALSTPELYARCLPSVVSISVHNARSSGVGSGFVFREDGYIATAYHVVADMDHIEVILSDGRRYEAALVGGDALTDLALLKVEATDLAPVSFGSSSELLAGERVVAIGTPASLDYAGSVSSGEVSYCLRTVKIFGEDHALEKKMKLIQTNAPVNPGNSGCPLFDGYGRVIGMITMKLGSSFAGMGFAIPSDGALSILEAMRMGLPLDDEVLAVVSVRAASLGVLGEACERDGICGVRVTGFSEGATIAAILWENDLLLSMGAHVIARMADIEQALLSYEPGDVVTVTVLRNGQELQFEVVLQAGGHGVKK